MKTIGAFEAKTHFSALLEEIERGQEVTITKHGRPVARLVPIAAGKTMSVDDAIEGLRQLRARLNLKDDWKTLRDVGRR